MNKLLAILLLCTSFSVTAQTTKEYNDARAKIRTISGTFNSISVSSGVQLYLTQANETALATSVSDDKYEDRFKTEVVNGVLKIYYDNKGITSSNDKNRKLKAYLSVKDINAISGSAGASVRLSGAFNLPSLSINFSSGSIFTGELKVASLQANASSGANISTSGTADKTEISLTSGALFKGFDLVSQYCSAKANSGAVIRIEVQKELKASANSGAVISYEGDPQVNRGSINSGGTVKKAS
ncbi:MAG: DUF2807 domain-containing protein [Gloeobacteraceae cyanobacterium ES-bin-316]|nr:DUF2807 domain-containing protein [Ferruginibacter sp.]